MNETRTVRVTGKGMIRLKPDTTRITAALEGVEADYAAAAAGFSRDDLKTANFQVTTEYEGYQEDGVYRQRIVGYRFRHELSIEFSSDYGRLGQLLAAVSETALTPEIRIAYTVRDREAAKNALLALAVADAKAKANALTAAAGVKLGGIRHIHYSVNESAFASQPVLFAGMSRKMSADNAAPEIVPEEITAEDVVSIVWEIE